MQSMGVLHFSMIVKAIMTCMSLLLSIYGAHFAFLHEALHNDEALAVYRWNMLTWVLPITTSSCGPRNSFKLLTVSSMVSNSEHICAMWEVRSNKATLLNSHLDSLSDSSIFSLTCACKRPYAQTSFFMPSLNNIIVQHASSNACMHVWAPR